MNREHRTNKSGSNKARHQKGQERKRNDRRGGEKGDDRRYYRESSRWRFSRNDPHGRYRQYHSRTPAIAVAGGGSLFAAWMAAKVASPACGPAVVVCALVL
jgi:hypothetical protein